MRLIGLFLTLVAISSATVITSGTIATRNFGGPTNVNLVTAGYTITFSENVGGDFCATHTATTCALGLSNALSSFPGGGSVLVSMGGLPVAGSWNASLVGNFTYSLAPTFDLTLGNVTSDRAFSYSGTLTVTSAISGQTLISETITGSGTQNLAIQAPVGAIGSVTTTNTFSSAVATPEPASVGGMLLGGLLLLGARLRRHRSARCGQ